MIDFQIMDTEKVENDIFLKRNYINHVTNPTKLINITILLQMQATQLRTAP